MKYFITGTRRGLGEALKLKWTGQCVNTLEECDVFINCKHDGFSQVELLYKAAESVSYTHLTLPTTPYV